VLVSGEFVISFTEREARLRAPGDYAMWGPGVRHTWRAEADSVVLTVRFRPNTAG
jgi:quercetin dioxygenase-like cupin family protein